MADQEGSPLPSQPSLQELCEKKLLGQILCSDKPDSDFASLNPHAQVLLFTRLRTETARLREGDRKWRVLKRLCPRTDVQIYSSSTRIEPGDEEDEQNGYNQRDRFQDQWSYLDDDGHAEDQSHPGGDEASDPELVCNTRWNCFNLVSEPANPDLKLCFHDHYWTRCPCRPKVYEGFSQLVSSQLLFYRLTVTFGMPPPREVDGYKSCWMVDLRHMDGVSVLSFQDYKGAADVRFHGTAEASAGALELMNFLSGMNCVHTYDGIVAGTIA